MSEPQLSLQETTRKAAQDANQLVSPTPLDLSNQPLTPAENISQLAQPALSNSAAVNPPSAPTSAAGNPLDQLRDIHLPEPTSFFPSAPGWWILASLILLTLGYLFYRHFRFKQLIALIKPASEEIAQLQKSHASASNLAKLSALLKRVSLLYFPAAQIASLKGQDWIEFLNHKGLEASQKSAQFSPYQGKLLTQVAYQKSPEIKAEDWQQLLVISQNWIENIIRYQAKRQLSGGKRE